MIRKSPSLLTISAWTNAVLFELRIFQEAPGERGDARLHGLFDCWPYWGSFCLSYLCSL